MNEFERDVEVTRLRSDLQRYWLQLITAPLHHTGALIRLCVLVVVIVVAARYAELSFSLVDFLKSAVPVLGAFGIGVGGGGALHAWRARRRAIGPNAAGRGGGRGV